MIGIATQGYTLMQNETRRCRAKMMKMKNDEKTSAIDPAHAHHPLLVSVGPSELLLGVTSRPTASGSD